MSDRKRLDQSTIKRLAQEGISETVIAELSTTTPQTYPQDVTDKFKEEEEMESTVRVTVDLRRSKHRKLKRTATDLGTDMNKVIKILIDDFLDRF